MFDPAFLIRQCLSFFILPLWIAAGLTGYYLHRRTNIEHISGIKELWDVPLVVRFRSVHSLLELLSLMGVSFVTILY